MSEADIKQQVQAEETNQYEEILVNDANAIDAYIENIYLKSVPPPQAPTSEELSFWVIAGLEASLFVLSAVGAAILSAIRTGGLFYILEVKLIEKFGLDKTFGSFLGFISMVTALLAFEGFLLAYGLTKGKESGKIQVSKTGLGVSLATVMLVGIFSSFSIVSVTNGWQSFMDILIALSTGAASSLVAFYSSENLGFILNHVRTKRNEITKLHQDSYMEWRNNAVASYLKSAYNIRTKRSDKIYGASKPLQNTSKNEVENEVASNNTSKPKKKLKLNEAIKEFIVEIVKSQSRFPAMAEIVDKFQCSEPTAFYSMVELIVEEKEYLLANGIVDQERINKAIVSLEKKNKTSQHQNTPA